MPMGVVYLFKVVQIDENNGKFVVVALLTIDFRVEDESHVAGVVERGAIILDGQLVNALDVAGILEGNRGKVRKRFEEFQVSRIETLRADAINEFNHAQAGVPEFYRHGDNRARLHFGLLVHFAEEASVLGGIRYDNYFAVLRDPASNSLPQFDPNIFEGLRSFSHGQFEIQFLLGFIEEKKGPVVGTQKLVDL